MWSPGGFHMLSAGQPVHVIWELIAEFIAVDNIESVLVDQNCTFVSKYAHSNIQK